MSFHVFLTIGTIIMSLVSIEIATIQTRSGQPSILFRIMSIMLVCCVLILLSTGCTPRY